MKARDATSDAGRATDMTGSPKEAASSGIIGMIMVAVTVLLEKMIFNKEMKKTITKTMTYAGSLPIPDSRTIDSHRAAPVV